MKDGGQESNMIRFVIKKDNPCVFGPVSPETDRERELCTQEVYWGVFLRPAFEGRQKRMGLGRGHS